MLIIVHVKLQFHVLIQWNAGQLGYRETPDGPLKTYLKCALFAGQNCIAPYMFYKKEVYKNPSTRKPNKFGSVPESSEVFLWFHNNIYDVY